LEFARHTAGSATVPTIFFGGGTPTLMESSDLGRVITSISEHFELASDVEITTEANPDTVTKEKLAALREAGFNRISFGMQSAVPHVLQSLDRTHNPENVLKATTWAREVGFSEVSVDLIYGTAGESLADWELTIDTALSLPITHISAYALIVESGTKLGAQVKRGEVTMPDDDQTADKYLLADEKFIAAGFDWYELSNWSKPGSECGHNMAYWNGDNWWGLGAGAHSHLSGRRFWNVKHPAAYTQKVLESGNPMHDQELLTGEEARSEEIMLQIRLASGIALSSLSVKESQSLPAFLAEGYLLSSAWEHGRVVLSQSGRLIADRIVREILV
jgi:oxygen-independent coproporphyrinogen-3 oxidase